MTESKPSDPLPRPSFGLTYLIKDDKRPMKKPSEKVCPRGHETYPVIVPSGAPVYWCLCHAGKEFLDL